MESQKTRQPDQKERKRDVMYNPKSLKAEEFISDEEIREIAKKACENMPSSQKYLRGLYTGGTYMDEAMRAMTGVIGDIYSNAPL